MSSSFARGVATDINDMKRSLGALVGIAQGLVCDGELNDREIRFLSAWLEQNPGVADVWPGDIVSARVREVLADGIVTEKERKYLLDTLSQLVGGSNTKLASQAHVTDFGFDDVPSVQFLDNRFCLTGDFVFGTREACSEAIEKRGGIVCAVTKKLQYLIVGTLGSAEWKHGSFGTKFEKAMQYKKEGCPILVLREERWSACL